ncbi:MAG: dihydroorotate dehydrogenase [Desulfosalsimonadaceae bacterium]
MPQSVRPPIQSNESPLQVQIGAIQMKNPVMTASGTFGYGVEFSGLMDLNRLGGIVVKGLSLAPVPGNPPPRIAETACGMLNAIGLENIGVEAFVKEKLPVLKGFDTPVIANIYGTSVDEYARLAQKIDGIDGIDGIEVNISCPNVKAGGVAFGTDPEMAAQVVAAVKAQTGKTIIVKLSPNVTSVAGIAQSAEASGADAVSLINTITGMAIDAETRRPVLGNITGGLSGPAIKPVALRMVWEVARAVAIPVIGIGGIMTAADALEFIIAGATAVQVGTATFVNPSACIDIIDGMADYLARHEISCIRELTGTLSLD